MLVIEAPDTYQAERHYILDVLLTEFLGLEYQFVAVAGNQTRLRLSDDPQGLSLCLPDVLFQTAREHWLSPSSCPRGPLLQWLVPAPLQVCCLASSLPVIYGVPADKTQQHWQENNEGITLGIDIFGSAFFFLTRYEEVAQKVTRDNHDRFPASASLAVREGFVQRPIVNEYLEILRWSLKKLWPQLSTTQRNYRVFLSHDIDQPLSVREDLLRSARSLTRDISQRRDFTLAAQRIRSRWKKNCGNQSGSFDCDPHNTFDFLMTQSERHGLQSAFFFLSGNSAGLIDANYALDEPWLLPLYQRIHRRGHEIGLHPSYNTYLDAQRTKQEFEGLQKAVALAGIEQETWGGRQHYLRWKNPETWQNWDDVGLNYDSTLGFADQAGFRCGVCYDFPVFNLRSRRVLRLRERPLIVMEVSLLAYMKLTVESALEEIQTLNAICRRYKGDFTLLWHNSTLLGEAQKNFYKRVIQVIAA